MSYLKRKAGAWLLDDVEVEASAAGLNAAVKGAHGCSFVIGAEAADVINVGIQLKDADGADLAEPVVVTVYLSDNADGSTLLATAPSGTVAVGTDGVVLAAVVAKKVLTVLAESDGDIDLNITEAGAKTLYVVVVLANGTLAVSSAVTFAA